MLFKRRIKQLVGKLPLRAIFVIPFIIQILVIVSLTGYLSFRNGEQAINELATDLQSEVAKRIEERLNQYLTTPHLLNEIEANAIETGQIGLVDDVSILPYFWKNLRIFPELNATFVGTEDGLMVGARRLTNRQIEVMLASPSTSQSLNYYVANENGLPDKFVEGAPDYDPRLRSWYTQAMEIGRPHWSPIYLDFSTNMLVITAGRPLYGADGQPIGVIGSAFQFEQVNDFLAELEIGENGQTFIIDRSGFLVGTSIDAPISKAVNNNLVRLEAIESTDLVQREITLLLYEQFGDLHNINEQQNLRFTINNEEYYTHISPIRDEYGLNWLIAVIIPTNDFMGEIQANNRTTIYMILLALGVAIVTGVITSTWVTRPLRQLRDSADSFSQGNWQHRVSIDREDELGDLVTTFNQMADELENAFMLLEQRVAQRTEALAQAKNALEVRVEQRTAELTAANEALKQSQKRYESMFHYVPIMLWEEDYSSVKDYIDQLKEQGITDLDGYFHENPAAVEYCASLVKVLAVNQTTLELLQTDMETALTDFSKFFGQASFGVLQREIVALSQGRTQFEAESNATTTDGRELQIYIRLVIAPGHEHDWSRILLSIEDITQRIEMENALRESEQWLKQAQYMAQMGNWEFNVITEEIVWSEELFRLFERPVEAGPPSYEENTAYYLPEDGEKLQQQVEIAIETGQEFSDTYRLKLPSGKIVYHASTIFPVKDENGRIIKLT
ncbi:MAG: HAMP domain-containing protein, partial [Anaerolineales bacterium]|nr:HAMP domain-containing protein [Anaerolineales bacterium]